MSKGKKKRSGQIEYLASVLHLTAALLSLAAAVLALSKKPRQKELKKRA